MLENKGDDSIDENSRIVKKKILKFLRIFFFTLRQEKTEN